MAKQPEPDGILIELPTELLQAVRSACRKVGLSEQDLVYHLLQKWLTEGGTDPRSETADRAKISRELTAAGLLVECLPFEITIKRLISDEIKYVWVNEYFRSMVGLDFTQIEGKTTAEVWSHDSLRANDIEKLDRDVITQKRPLKHVDAVNHSAVHYEPRYRVGIRFPLGDPAVAPTEFIGSIGLDFDSEAAANEACKALRFAGDWAARRRAK